MSPWHDVLTVLAFFSRLPVPHDPRSSGAVAGAVGMVPVVGALIALPAGVLLLVLHGLGASPWVAATMAVLALIVTTGALHEDGLADCADGFWGGATPERRLAIMRDSRVGTFGVLALVGAVLLKVSLLQAALAAGAGAAASAFVASAAAGRAVALYPWVGLPNARGSGLAAEAGRPDPAAFRKALVLAVLIGALLLVWRSPLGFVAAGIAAAATAKAVACLADSKIGGHTGDVIGAAVVLCELAFLGVFTIWTG